MKQVNPIWNLDKDAKKNVTGEKKKACNAF